MEACTLCSYTNSNFHNNIINRQGAGEVQCRCMNYDPDDIDKIVKVLELTAMITQTSWIQNIVIDTMKE